MLCRDCIAMVERAGLSSHRARRATPGAEPLESLLCRRCGAVLAPEDLTDRLLEKLTQLDLFGLGEGALPLLEPPPGGAKDG